MAGKRLVRAVYVVLVLITIGFAEAALWTAKSTDLTAKLAGQAIGTAVVLAMVWFWNEAENF